MTTKNILFKVFDELKNMGYISNGSKQHESAVEKILVKHGMKSVKGEASRKAKNKSQKTKAIKEWVAQGNFPDWHYISQPYGSQSAPDFMIFYKGKKIELECKSSKGGTITWNSGFPTKERIYLYSCGNQLQSTYFMGDDWITHQQYILLQAAKEDLKKKTKEWNDRFKKEQPDCPLYLYFREMWQDTEKPALREGIAHRHKKVHNYLRRL